MGSALLAAYESGTFPEPSSETFPAEFKALVKAIGKDLGRKGKGLFMPMRIALTGRTSGPEVVDQLRVSHPRLPTSARLGARRAPRH